MSISSSAVLSRLATKKSLRVLVAAFVSITTEDYLRCMLPRQDLTFARSWPELSSLLSTDQFKISIIDPSADGMANTEAAATLLRKYPEVYTLAYLIPTPDNLNAVFQLSKIGLQDVFVHPASKHDRKLSHAVDRADGNRLGGDLLSAVEPKLATLPPTVARTVLDVFQRPHRYQTVCDIADEASVPSRCLYEWLNRAGLPTPKQLLIVAKAIHGYSYFAHSNSSASSVAHKLGYSDVRVFSRHMSKVFGRYGRVRGSGFDSEGVMPQLLKSMSKSSISCGPRCSINSEHEA
jgi:AraC-like DNA-binding protein